MTPTDKLELKLQLVQATVRQIHENYTGAEDEAEQIDRLLGVLSIYELSLMRQKLSMPTTEKQIQWVKQSIRDAGCLLVDLGQDEAMQGWYHGATPKNVSFAVANLLSRIILELSAEVNGFESNYPERKQEFDAGRRHHALLISSNQD